MEAGGGLVNQNEGMRSGIRGAGSGIWDAGEVGHQFEPLGLAAGEGVERLAQLEVAEADVDQGLEAFDYLRVLSEEKKRFVDIEIENLCDALVVEFDVEDFVLETPAFAALTRNEEVGYELHLDAFEAEAGAGGATSVAAVERKVPRSHACGLGGLGLGEEFADHIPGFAITGGVGAGCFADRTLINEDDVRERQGGLDVLERGGLLDGEAFLCE